MWLRPEEGLVTKPLGRRLRRFFCWLTLAFSHLSALLRADDTHTARYAHLHELTSILHHSTEGLVIGLTKFGHAIRIHNEDKRRYNNLLVVAPTGGGKSLLAQNQIFRWPHSIIVNDIKGELYKNTNAYRRTLGKVYQLTTDTTGSNFNPLQGMKTEKDFTVAATNLLYKGETKDPVFNQRAIVMLTQIFIASLLEDIPPFLYVRLLIRSGLEGSIRRLEGISPELATQFLDMPYKEGTAYHDDHFLSSCWGTLCAPMRLLLTDEIVDSLSGSDFTPESIITAREPVTIYICYPERELKALAPLIQLTYASLFDGMMKAYDEREGNGCYPVFVPIDEGGVTPIPDMPRFVSTANGRRIFIALYTQSLAQLHFLYGSHNADTIISNMQTRLHYRANMLDDMEYLQRSLGNPRDYEMSIRAFAEMKEDEILGFHGSLKPFRAKRLDWTHFPKN